MRALSTEKRNTKGKVVVRRKRPFTTYVVQQGHRTIFDIVQRPNLLPESQGGVKLASIEMEGVIRESTPVGCSNELRSTSTSRSQAQARCDSSVFLFENDSDTEHTVAMADYRTVSVRGIGFAPEKTTHLVLPEEVSTEKELAEFLKHDSVKAVGEAALESLLNQTSAGD